MLQQRLDHAAARASRTQGTVGVLFADLDRFKQVNDVFGHSVGDGVLCAVAHRLLGLIRAGDTLARVSGDEFVFLCEDLESTDDIEMLARRIDDAFVQPFVVSQIEIQVSASVGMAFAGPGSEVSEHLVADADSAMYQRKRDGGAGHQILDLREAMPSRGDNSLAKDLRRAVSRQELEVHYQPTLRCSDGAIVGVEALLRWTHLQRGRIPSLSIIKIAEQSRLINEIGEWVLKRSCRDRANWLQNRSDVPLDLSVNVSSLQLMSAGFVTALRRTVRDSAMDPSALILEITEDVVVEDSARVMNVLAAIRSEGIRLAMDDFGTGYSSLSYLRRLPIQIVKMDQSFIADMVHAPQGKTMITAITDLAHALGLQVVAEGIETSLQHREIAAVGCDLVQGFYYSKAVSAAEIGKLLAQFPTALRQ